MPADRGAAGNPGSAVAQSAHAAPDRVPDAPPAVPGPPREFALVAPRHPDGSDWPWLSHVGPFRRHCFRAVYIRNTFDAFPKATRLYVRWQYVKAMAAIAGVDLAFLFSTDINLGMTAWPAQMIHRPRRIYVGFTQDGVWEGGKIERLSAAMRKLDAVTVFSEEERRIYLERYALDPTRVHLIPIHTDEPDGYDRYVGAPPPPFVPKSYVLSLGSPNRRFMPVARACQARGIPLVVITRPWHKNDSLDELASMGATIITDADKMKSLVALRHARFAVMAFETDTLPGAFTTLIHAMFLGTPSVVTRCVGIGDYLIEGVNGLVTPHGHEDALRAAIDRLWNDAALVEGMRTAGLERAQRLYSLEAAAQKHEALAQHILSGAP